MTSKQDIVQEKDDEIEIADNKIAADSYAVNINSIVHLFLPLAGEIVYIGSFYFHL